MTDKSKCIHPGIRSQKKKSATNKTKQEEKKGGKK
jgi:hypothetical protein